jgi:hypothetical protein
MSRFIFRPAEQPNVCQWNAACPKLKACKEEMSWNRKPTAAEYARERAIRKAARDKGKAIGQAQRPLRIEAHNARTDDSEFPF